MSNGGGVEIVHAAVALLPGTGARDIQSVGQRVPHAAGLEVLAQVQLLAVEALVDVELALAALVGAAGGAAHLAAVLGGLAVLAGDLPVEAVGETGSGRVPLVEIGRAHV